LEGEGGDFDKGPIQWGIFGPQDARLSSVNLKEENSQKKGKFFHVIRNRQGFGKKKGEGVVKTKPKIKPVYKFPRVFFFIADKKKLGGGRVKLWAASKKVLPGEGETRLANQSSSKRGGFRSRPLGGLGIVTDTGFDL